MKQRKTVLLGSVLLLIFATYVLGYSTLFTVSKIEVIGSTTKLNPGIVPGQKLARVEPRVIASKFEQLAWVQGAKVSRNWINGTVTIELVARTPVAVFRNQVIDANGKSFTALGQPPEGLIEIQAVDMNAAVAAVEFMRTLPTDLKKAIRVIKVRGSGAFVMNIEDTQRKLEIRWGTNSDNDLKLQVYKALISLPENAGMRRVDLSAPHAPIVK